MEPRQIIKQFMNRVAKTMDGESSEYVMYLKRSLYDFISDNNPTNASNVYSYYMGIYRLSDTAGGPLTDLIDVMHNYETNASVLTYKHRDHYIHSINVFILGIQMYECNSSVRSAFNNIYGSGTFETPDQCFLYVWGNAALFHDIGYPIEIASAQAKKFLREIGSVCGPDKDMQVGLQIDPLENILTFDNSKWGGENSIINLMIEGVQRNLLERSKTASDLISQYPEQMFKGRYVDHGFFSAVILLRSYAQSMQAAGRTRDRFDNEVVTVASAILMHNLYPYNLAKDGSFGPLKISYHPAGYLLMLCDILQEWNRRGYGATNKNLKYPEHSGILIDDDTLRINYVSKSTRLPQKFADEKKTEVHEALDISDVFAESFDITCSCDSAADILEMDIAYHGRNDLPRPMLSSITKIAIAIHEEYNRNRLREFPDRPLEYPTWESLPQDLRYSNMCQALDYANKLDSIGYYIGLEGEEVTEFTEEEIEEMAVMEHERWKNERETNGWVYGKTKDVSKRISPYIAPWELIPEEIREYDREAVRSIIPILGLVGLKVIRK